MSENCEHCGGDISIRNPTGICDHLHYPEYCEICKLKSHIKELEKRLKKIWIECWNCGGSGYNGHDCGEDTCVCLTPYENVVCDICDSNGGWYNHE